MLRDRLKSALRKLNPDLPAEALQQAIDILTRDRSALSAVEANREVYQLLKDGAKVTAPTPALPRDNEAHRGGGSEATVVRVIDWDTPTNNDSLVASQLWITGSVYKKRTDLIGFVNGLPLIFLELKTAHRHLSDAYHDNLRDYKNTIPHLFWYNVFTILSNGSRSVMGSLTADWEHFAEWKKVASEQEQGVISLETMLRGVCQPDRLLDFTENFVLFTEAKGGLRKLIARNHQVLGVNRAIEAVKHARSARSNQGKLGVFWHTQGSGKSYSMVFFSQKILRKVPGNWTFLVVTDREELDRQIYQNFAGAAVVTEPEEAVRASSSEHLKQLLRDDHRYVFTLIQKFRTTGGAHAAGAAYPKLSDRDDIIVMADEAHRTQYDTLALNMRTGLPRAAYIAFTGTPLIAGEERLAFLRETDMAVVVSPAQNEEEDLRLRGADIRPHRLRLNKENLEEWCRAIAAAWTSTTLSSRGSPTTTRTRPMPKHYSHSSWTLHGI